MRPRPGRGEPCDEAEKGCQGPRRNTSSPLLSLDTLGKKEEQREEEDEEEGEEEEGGGVEEAEKKPSCLLDSCLGVGVA